MTVFIISYALTSFLAGYIRCAEHARRPRPVFYRPTQYRAAQV